MRFDSVSALMDGLRRSRLLSVAQINEIKLNHLIQATTPQALVETLVSYRYLTPYQAEHIIGNTDEPLVLGPYRILDLLGEGGLCKVYKAMHVDYQQAVALKIVHADLRSNPSVVEQFLGEIEMIATMEHPKFVKALDYHLEGDLHFFVMDFIDGLDLMRLVQQGGALPYPQACDYIHQAALGLQYAFEQGLVHRDVKPANIIVNYEGDKVYVLDIGLARLEWGFRDAVKSKAALEAQGAALMGTPDYVAPEQALRPQEADVRADIYSLGCTLYHLIAGEPPFPGASLARKLMHHQQTQAPSIREKKPDVPQELAATIQKLMAKNPAERPQTPAAVAIAMTAFMNNPEARVQPSQFRPPELPAPPPLPKPNKPAKAMNYGQPGGLPDRRMQSRIPNYPSSVYIAVEAHPDGALRGWCLNRSLGGVGLLVEEAVEIDTIRWVRPAAELYSECWFKVRIVYCIPERIRWRVGCQFLDAPSWDSLRVFGEK